MASKWDLILLGDIVNFTPKRTIKKSVVAPFVSMADIPVNSKYIPEIFEKEYKGGGTRFENGDTLFARITPCLQNGKTAKVSGLKDDDIAHGSTEFIIFAGKEPEYDQDYLYYLSRTAHFRSYAESRMEGSTGRQRVSWQALSEYEFKAPDKAERKKIGDFISSFDDKIELNQKTNQTLEQMAQTLFKSWFIDFDPVFDNLLAKAGFKLENLTNHLPEALLNRAKKRLLALDDNGKAALLSATLSSKTLSSENRTPANIHKHFPSEFEHNEQLGWIPKGWGVDSVSNAIEVNPRTTLSKDCIAKFADMKSIPTSGYMVDEVIEKVFSGGAKFKRNDILLARITPCLQNGKTALVDFLADDEVGFGSTEFIVLRESKGISYPYIACLARDEIFRAHCMQSMVGSSGRQRVQNACFDDYYLALPKGDNLLSLFSELTKPSFVKMTNNKFESQSLTKLRDTLLPKLISGELQIPNALETIENSTASLGTIFREQQ